MSFIMINKSLQKLNHWKKSIFIRLFIIFLIVMIPIYFIGITIYTWGITTVKAEISDSKALQISAFMDDFEKEIQRIKAQQSDCLMGDDLNRLANSHEYMNDYEKAYYMLKLQQRLNAIKNSSDFIENAVAIVPSIKKIIPGAGSISDLQDGDYKMLKESDNSTLSQITYINGQLYLNAIFPPNYTLESYDPLYSILIKLSSGRIYKALSQFNYYHDSGTILLSLEKKFYFVTGMDSDSISFVKNYIKDQLQTSSEGKNSILMGNERYLAVFKHSQFLGFTVCNFIPENQIYNSLNRYKIWFWIFSLTAVIILAIFSFFIYQHIQQPLKKLIKSFNRLEKGELNFSIKHNHNDEFENLYQHFNRMLQNLNLMIDQSFKQKIMVQQAELKQLQAQINPHFLYNSFFILYTMTRRGEYDVLEKFALQLGEYFQFMTRNANDEVLMGKEVNHARTYCNIQSMRFSNRINVEFDELPDDYSALKVPRLIIQPIVENAFEHAFKKKEQDGLLKIGFTVSECNRICIIIEDNGEEMGDSDIEEMNEKINSTGNEVETTGIINIHRRIRIKFGGKSGITVSRASIGGLKVAIGIFTEE